MIPKCKHSNKDVEIIESSNGNKYLIIPGFIDSLNTRTETEEDD